MRSLQIVSASAFLVISSFLIFTSSNSSSKRSDISKTTASQEEVDPIASCNTDNFTGLIDPYDRIAIFENNTIAVPEIQEDLAYTADLNVLGVSNGEKWIEVDLSDQKIYAWQGDSLYLESPISSGLRWWPTPTGEFRIWIKLKATKMEGGSGSTYYYLPNVPYVMYFGNNEVPNWRGYGLHGAYWHNDFGTPRSHGCVNLPIPVAEKLYYWVTPNLESGSSVQKSTSENPGTRIVIHE